MLLVDRILGSSVDAAYADRLHHLSHHGGVDWLTLPAAELARRRFRAVTSGGAEVAIALPRDEPLFDGAVLLFEPDRAIVVRVDAERWLRLRPQDTATALELGYHVGNLHWRVRFEGEEICVAVEGPVEAYRSRLTALGLDDRLAVTFSETAPSLC